MPCIMASTSKRPPKFVVLIPRDGLDPFPSLLAHQFHHLINLAVYHPEKNKAISHEVIKVDSSTQYILINQFVPQLAACIIVRWINYANLDKFCSPHFSRLSFNFKDPFSIMLYNVALNSPAVVYLENF